MGAKTGTGKGDGPAVTVIRGVAYDVSKFMEVHPGGRSMIVQAIGRDATGLFESYHIRNEVSELALKKLPRVANPGIAVETGPFPNDSPIYVRIRDRVRKEVLRGRSPRGGLLPHIIVDVVVTVAAYLYYLYVNTVLSGVLLGLVGAHIGMTLNHCANHGGLTTNPDVNFWFGFVNDLIGGSSLIWSYHHHVSHHIHTNSVHRDQDVFSAFPLLRFDKRLPGKWFHAYQYIYMIFLFPLLWANKHVSDLKTVLRGKTAAVELTGASTQDYGLLLAGKAVHFGLIVGLPWVFHGPQSLWAMTAFATVGSITLAWLFAISHNLEETKRDFDTDWGIEQIGHSANYGGYFAGLLTGGLNLQIEHHLFPAMAYNLYPAVVPIVKEECKRARVPYVSFKYVPQMMLSFVHFMKQVGEAA